MITGRMYTLGHRHPSSSRYIRYFDLIFYLCQLRKLGYTNIDGIDMSMDILEIAKTKVIFQNLIYGSIGGTNKSDILDGRTRF